jgi:hypothetical protein
LAAETDAKGYYESDFIFILGDEMITVWPFFPEVSFLPEYLYWRHYFGARGAAIDFIGVPAEDGATPSRDCRDKQRP